MTSLSRNLSDQIIEIIIRGFSNWGSALCGACCAQNTPPTESLMAPGGEISSIL